MKRILAAVLALAMISSAAVVNADAANNDTKQSGVYEYTINEQDGTAAIEKYNGSEKSVSVPSKLDGYTVTAIGENSFANCTSVETVTVPNTVTQIGKCAFFGCTSMTEISIPESVSSIEAGVFYKCTSMQNIFVDDKNTAYFDIDGVLCCSNEYNDLQTYPSGRTDEFYLVPKSITCISQGAFADCAELRRVVVVGDITRCGVIPFFHASDGTEPTTDGGSDASISMLAYYDSVIYAAKKKGNVFFNVYPLDYGDVNGDGYVTAVDSFLVQRAAINLTQLTDKQRELGNVLRDSVLDSRDSMYILRASIGLTYGYSLFFTVLKVRKELGIYGQQF